ncbi:NAD(P)H:quinone oxidoreductase [Fibrivirga algicola]|uniref:NAD(P)H:quinone oxidoreductase n=1 Tax=Fibrivirga algicola TaxID=2950420 RepID=A0ABX0QIP6_9BACT|nr:NAD(P)H:quinone oxidoreductase [Fibrivirga algicola]ARK13769.1 NAD(P)H dehydrogenase [Fibrella sp. ES10-3-2-2]NID12310.1 NAD(P)H:quinone oxidoreductase [Fibrivirga algicola]
MAKVAIIYYSATGTTYKLAKAIEEGATAAGAEVRLLKVKELAPDEAIASNEGWSKHRLETQDLPEATLDDLEWADAIILGTPTRYGLPSSQLKQFLDSTGPLWGAGKLINKVGSSFCTVATLHGGHESTILAINNTFYSWGALIVAPSYADPIQFQSGNPYGASFTSQNGTLSPDETALASARFQGKRVTEVTAKFIGQ